MSKYVLHLSPKTGLYRLYLILEFLQCANSIFTAGKKAQKTLLELKAIPLRTATLNGMFS